MTFEDFLSEQMEALRRYARLLTGSREEAHDVLADALVKAHMRWSDIGRTEYPTAYVRSMVTNGYLSERRRWARRITRPTVSGEVPEGRVPDPARGVDDRAQLDQLLRSLPRQQRAAVVLRYYLDASDRQIAEELGCSEGAARTYISRGVAALRQRFPIGESSDPRVPAKSNRMIGDRT